MNISRNFLIFFLLTITIGCGGAKIRREKPVDTLYKDAMTFFEKKRYEDAISAFQELNAKYPLSRYAIEAKLKIADSYLNDENYAEAISAYREVEKLHPTNENIPYVIFQIGMSYFNQIQTIDRDQTATRNAAIEFSRLLSRFPENRYAEEAKKNLRICRNSLAENEFYIGNFYYKKGNYKAALERLNSVMKDYPDFSGVDKVLFYAGSAYIKNNEGEKGKELLERLLQDYPSSKFAEWAREITENR